jgi:transcriptional regulator with XRE-family HTH domain
MIQVVDDQQVGMAIRTVRVRRRKRQRDIAAEAGVGPSTVSRIERGRLDQLSIATVRKVCFRLELRAEIRLRSRGADLDRMLAARHSALVEAVIARLREDFPGWEVVPEASFAIRGEWGVIDILAWHPGRRALLLIEVKTEIVDVGEMLGTFDRKRRLAREIAAERGWEPSSVSAWIVVSESRTNERRIHDHRTTLRAGYPDDGRRMRSWLADPIEPRTALSIWRVGPAAAGAVAAGAVTAAGRATAGGATAGRATAPVKRVRAPGPAKARAMSAGGSMSAGTGSMSAKRPPGDR